MDDNNYNHMYLGGDTQWTDIVYCEKMDLDPALAHTPKINDAFLEKNPDMRDSLEKRLMSRGLMTWDS